MLYSIVGNQVFSIKSDDVVLPVGDASRTDVHGDSEGREGVGAGHPDVVDHADHGVSIDVVGSGPEAAIPGMVIEDDFDFVGN